MVKIVGVDPSITKRITCKNCGSINEYTPQDVKVLWSGTDYSGHADGAKGFGCGNCGKQVITERW